MMTLHCREVQQSLKAFHAEKLDADACAAVETHLSHCAKCRSAARRQGLTRLLRAAAPSSGSGAVGFFHDPLEQRPGRLAGTAATCNNG